ncbi:recombinase family protein [Cellulosilyticum sp. ST5]|uniref:recombinase family protein n=1 Tax=Cellulosilyticum sp. ST5 TaxID=3055805 RepID=UPI00397730BD
MFRHLPYGYKLNLENRIVLNEKEAPFVEAIFEKYLSGVSQIDITKWLIKVNAPTPSDTWKYRSIGYILKNKKYQGTNQFPSIISKNMYLEVNKSRYEEGRYKSTYYNNTPYNKKKKYPFTGIVVCGKCNQTCQSHIVCPNKPYRRQVWRCGNYISEGKVSCRISIDNTELEQLFIQVFAEFYNKFESLEKVPVKKESTKTSYELLKVDLVIKEALQESTPNTQMILDLLDRRVKEIWDHTVLDDYEEESAKLRELLYEIKEVPQEFDGNLFNKVIKQVTLFPSGKVDFVFLNNIVLHKNYTDYSKRGKE